MVMHPGIQLPTAWIDLGDGGAGGAVEKIASFSEVGLFHVVALLSLAVGAASCPTEACIAALTVISCSMF